MKNFKPTTVTRVKNTAGSIFAIIYSFIGHFLISYSVENNFDNFILGSIFFTTILSIPVYTAVSNYLLTKFKSQIHSEIHTEFELEYITTITANCGDDVDIDLVKKGKLTNQDFISDYKKLIKERDILLRKY